MRPRGSSSASGRSGPPSHCPAPSSPSRTEAPPTPASSARRDIVIGPGEGARSGIPCAPAPRGGRRGKGLLAGPQGRPHRPELERDVGDEGADEHPGSVVVGLDEVEPEHVPVLDVQDAGDELEQDAADEQRQRRALQRVGGRAERRPLEQARQHRPQLGQHDRGQGQADGDVQALGEAVEPRRPSRPAEQIDVQRTAAVAPQPVAPQTGLVGVVGEQPGEDQDGQSEQQHQPEHRGQPRASQGAAPEAGAEGAGGCRSKARSHESVTLTWPRGPRQQPGTALRACSCQG